MKIPLLLLGCFLFSHLALALPKYGPNAVPLSRRTNLEYFQKNPAPDFWALMPYYTGQKLGQQCSAATFTMVLNAARVGRELSSGDPLVTLDSLLEKYTDDRYRSAMTASLRNPHIVTAADVHSRRLAEVLTIALKKIGVATPATQVEYRLVDRKDLPKSRQTFHESLVTNEKSADDFLIVSSFYQGVLTGDPEGGSHVAVVGAYDATRKLVLLMDPDREWYEPYWSPEEKVFDAIADPRYAADNSGWIYAQVR